MPPRPGGGRWMNGLAKSTVAASTSRCSSSSGCFTKNCSRASLPAMKTARLSPLPAAGPAPLLPQAGHRARVAHRDRRVERADVDAELERAGADHGEQLAAEQQRLDGAALLGRVSGSVRGELVGQMRVGLLETVGRLLVDELGASSGLGEADGADAAADELGQQIRPPRWWCCGAGSIAPPPEAAARRPPCAARQALRRRSRGSRRARYRCWACSRALRMVAEARMKRGSAP